MADIPSKQQCTCAETCQRKGRAFPADWSWQCKQLPYMQDWRPAGETTCNECERLRVVIRTLLTEVSQAEGDYGIGLAMTKAEKAIGWSVMDQSPEKTGEKP